MFRRGNWTMKKSWILVLFLVLFLAPFCFGATTYSINTTTASISNYTGTALSVTVNLTVTRSAKGGATPIYLLVSGANTDGQHLPGTRRVYRNGSMTDSSMRIYLYPSTGTTEIGTTNTSGTTATSATFATNSFTRTVAVKFTTGVGKVPLGTYTNTFMFQLYTGSLTPGGVGNQLQSGVVGFITVSVLSTTSNTFSMLLGTTNLSFGSNLAADSSYTAQTTMTITAPTNFSISAKSENQGYMIGTNGESFPYHLYFNGSATESLLTGGLVKLITSAGSVSNKPYLLRFNTDVLGFLVADDYSDNLVLMFTTQ